MRSSKPTMAVVCIRGQLKALAGGRGEHRLAGATVAGLLQTLEAEHPALAGWILDEHGQVRRHINVFVNGDQGRGTTAVADDDRIDVIPAISGGT